MFSRLAHVNRASGLLRPRFFASSRLAPRTPETGLSEEQEVVFKRIEEDRGKTGSKAGFPVKNEDGSLVGPWNAMVTSPIIGGLAERMGNFCRHRNACAMDLYEIGILVVGVEWKSQFEWFAHDKLARKAGVSEDAIEGIRQGLPAADVTGFTENQRAVYAYAKEFHKYKRVTDATHEAALKAVESEEALVDLVFTMGFYHQICMTLNAFNVPLPPGVEPA
eukprot:CAMPEP_0206584720 /NCGR_PEP_ID=MMETSP0325_2-20121206/35925_1 /ASSEMBLY_ACC=CAM_ASM_000347 /TAXON_ID=2866 /ORGANISM="Crypthecodinium cohnii, Strain Seligo" /LENGTH=220 /DNA_ID=CAMNT_0054092001 /DNA_START=81 /DNA_END=739 /DNA_ORIENTATION=-